MLLLLVVVVVDAAVVVVDDDVVDVSTVVDVGDVVVIDGCAAPLCSSMNAVATL
jgi:hypothetical protein